MKIVFIIILISINYISYSQTALHHFDRNSNHFGVGTAFAPGINNFSYFFVVKQLWFDVEFNRANSINSHDQGYEVNLHYAFNKEQDIQFLLGGGCKLFDPGKNKRFVAEFGSIYEFGPVKLFLLFDLIQMNGRLGIVFSVIN